MNLSTEVSDLSLRELRHLTRACIDFCKNRLGENKRHKNEITFSITQDRDCSMFGEYNPTLNKIVMYRNTCETVKEFIHTLIHEYTHSTQPVKTKYFKLLNQFGYKDHPHEIEANKNGDELYRAFWFPYKRSLKEKS